MDGKYIGEIVLFAGTYTPDDFVDCDGRMLNIQDHQALYSVIGTTYGGDGHRSFAVPDLRGRSPLGFNQTYPLGKPGGAEPGEVTLQLTPANLPPHTHSIKSQGSAALKVSKNTGDSNVADGNVLALGTTAGGDIPNVYATSSADPAPAGKLSGLDIAITTTAESAGKGEPVKLGLQRHPYLAVRYIICINGVYPPRS